MIQLLRVRLSAWIGDTTLKRLLKNASMLFGAETLVTLISVVQFPLVTRLLGSANYGAWGVVISWVSLVGQVVSIRLWETVIKYVTQFLAQHDEDRARAIIKLCMLIDLVLSLLFVLVLGLTAEWVAAWLVKRPDGADLIRLETLHIMMTLGSAVWVPLLRAFGRFRQISIFNVVSAVMIFAFFMAALSLGLGVAGMITAVTLVALGQTVAVAIMAERELRAHFKRHWITADLRALSGYRREVGAMLFSINIDSLRKIVVGNADMVMLGWLATPAQVGVYRLAKQLASYFNRLTDPIYDTLYPEVARLYAAEGPAAVRALVNRLMRGVLLGLAASIAGAYILSPWLVPLILGPEYVASISLFHIVVLSNLWAVGLWVPSVMLSAGRAKQLTAINTVSSLMMLVMLLVLVRPLGALGAAIALLFFHGTWLALAYPAARKVLAT